MNLYEMVSEKILSDDTLKTGSGLHGYKHPENPLQQGVSACNQIVTDVTIVTGLQNQALTEQSKPVENEEWKAAMDILEKRSDFCEKLYNDNPNIYRSIESNPVLLKSEENADSIVIKMRTEPDQNVRKAMLDKLILACRFYCKKLKALKATL